MNLDDNTRGNLAIASLVVGVFNLCAWLIPLCGCPLSLVGIGLGAVSVQSSKRNLAVIGIVLSALALLLAICNSIIGAYLGANPQIMEDFLRNLN